MQRSIMLVVLVSTMAVGEEAVRFDAPAVSTGSPAWNAVGLAGGSLTGLALGLGGGAGLSSAVNSRSAPFVMVGALVGLTAGALIGWLWGDVARQGSFAARLSLVVVSVLGASVAITTVGLLASGLPRGVP